MLIPQDPKNNKQIADSCLESLAAHNDFIVLDGQSFSAGRRSDDLSKQEKQIFIDGFLNSDVRRVSVSRQCAIPPYFGLQKVGKGLLKLDYYVARAVAEENQLNVGMIKDDMEILTAFMEIEEARYLIQIPDELAVLLGLEVNPEGYAVLS